MSFADTELDLNDMGNILVTGRNYCKLDNAYSNGSGKSSIFNAICFALTGETSQGVSSGVENIFTNPGDCWVELEFEADGDLFVIKRIKTPWHNMKVYVNGEDVSGKGVRESTKVLMNYLPDLTSELISSAIILGQGLPYRFSNNNPAQRKEILEKLTKSDFMIQSIKDKLEMRQDTLRQNLRLKEDDLLSNTSQKSVYESRLSQIDNQLEEYSSEDDIEDAIIDLKSNMEYTTNLVSQYNINLTTLEKDLDELNKEKSELIFKENDKFNSSIKTLKDEIDSLNAEHTDNVLSKKVLEKEIKKLDSITDVCPTCGQKIPDVNKPDTTEKKKELEAWKLKCNEQKHKIEELENKRDRLTEEFKQNLDNKIKDLDNLIADKKQDIDTVKTSIAEYNNNLIKLTGDLYNYQNLKSNYDRLSVDKAEVIDKLDKLDNESIELNTDIVSIKSHLNIVQQMVTIAKREFRGILLSNIIEFINKKVKQYSLSVFGTTELNFTLNENCIDITYHDKMYENLSGGEKQKIDIIIQLALRDILSKQLNIHTNLLICDEIYDNMDSISCQKITNLISTLTDISSIFIISHHAQDLEITYDSQLLVEKDENGISSISFV
ncbi:MAG: hypothetical protein IJH34_11480 [Romboutsia sp.]|nr:hypothetical protein [Romboutsia sp.]